MRSLLARLAVLGAFAVSAAACSGGNGNSLPFAGPPNNAGGSPGTVQTGGNGVSLIRFVQGSPDSGTGKSGVVDVCIDNLPFGVLFPSAAYGGTTTGLYSVPGGITHTISVYPGLGTPTSSNGGAGAECPTAPGPYFGNAPIRVTTLAPATAPSLNSRLTVVLAGTAASKTLGLYVFAEPTFPVAPAGLEVISHNAAPAFSAVQAAAKAGTGVGFGTCGALVGGVCGSFAGLSGAGNVAAPKVSSAGAAVVNSAATSAINNIPAGFYDGIGVTAGSPTPIAAIGAPNALAGQPYVVDLYAIDTAGGGLGIMAVPEQTLGFGF